MVTKWGIFLCNCQQTLSIDPLCLDLPTPYVQLASHPDTDARTFVEMVERERLERVLIGCCAASNLFDDALNGLGASTAKVHFINLKESCFRAHADAGQAHEKASRLLRAALRSSEAQAEPTYNPLRAGDRILIVTDSLQGQRLAERLQDVARPFLVLEAEPPGFDPAASWRIHRGQVLEVQGRLGAFRVMMRDTTTGTRELQADQVVVISRHAAFPVKARTGCYHLTEPDASEIDQLAGRVRDLIGDFLKTVHVNYHADICAGGIPNQEACGLCIAACPYDAIARDPQTSFRIQVDHMACEGCGACASVCPTSALRFTDPSPYELYTRLAALLAPLPDRRNGKRHAVIFHCGEQGKRVFEAAGLQSQSYPANVLPVQVPCLRYVSEADVLAAFRMGAAGVGLLGCNACKHGEREVLHEKLDFCHLTLEAFDLGTERLRLITAEDGAEAETMATLSRFAVSLTDAPISWSGQALQHSGNREVIAEALAAFIEQTGHEPGRRVLRMPHPFAFAEVKESGCTLCRSCINVCPAHAFKLEADTSSLQYKHLACVACGLCESVCPEQVITLRGEIYLERDAFDYQTVVQDDMVSCARCGKPYINRQALETIESRVLSVESLLDTFSGRRRTLLRMCPDCRAVAAMLEVEKGWEP